MCNLPVSFLSNDMTSKYIFAYFFLFLFFKPNIFVIHIFSVAEMTSEIHRLQKHMQEHPRNLKCKVVLKEKIDRRKMYLKKLRTWDYKRFEWILEKLNLIYKPPPE